MFFWHSMGCCLKPPPAFLPTNQTFLTPCPAAALQTQVHTLFPSPKTEEGVKGGVVLLRMLPPEGGEAPLGLEVSYVNREGDKFR